MSPGRVFLLGPVTLVLACATVAAGRDEGRIPLEELLAGAPLGVTLDSSSLIDDAEVLAVSAEMEEFLNEHVSPGATRVPRLRQLGYAIISARTFGLEYDETTRTAAETFRTRRGNCLSFSNMFVAMARHVRLKAYYQEVDTPPDWSFRDEAFVLNRHVNVLVDLGLRGEHVVDFNMDDFRTSYDRRRISDARAKAHYYNNMAVESMQAGDNATAFLYFRRAIERDSSFSPAWTNLGTLYRREGHPVYAEAAYLQALKADDKDLVTMSNLAGFYGQRGDQQRAEKYQKRVRAHRQRNPYYRYHLARRAFEAGEFDTAIDHLEYAVRSKDNEDRFYFLMGLSHLRKGGEDKARQWLTRAQDVAATDALKRRYSDKIDILMSASSAAPRPR
jgi:Flp pilus assembly protein TadD